MKPMKGISTYSKIIAAALAVLALAAVADQWKPARLVAFQEVNERPNPNDFAMFTVMPEDIVRINIVNVSVSDPLSPCRVEVSLYRADGAVVRQEWLMVAPG